MTSILKKLKYMNINTLESYKVICLAIILSFVCTTVLSQEANNTGKSEFWSHVRVGGGIGLSFGEGFFSGTLAPSAIYQFNEQFAFGVGLSGTYNTQKNFYKSTILGGSLIGLYNPIHELQISAELEQLNVDRDYDQNIYDQFNNLYQDENYWNTALFIGVGYRTANVTFGIRYDILYDRDTSIYYDPWAPFVRVYF